MNRLNQSYWENRYQEADTPWDLNQVSPPLKAYFDQLEDKSLHLLIPGAGKGYEAAYLWKQGFRNVYVCDWAPTAFEHLRTLVPDFPEGNCLIGDFFDLDQPFDRIIEQTFFCAIDPALRRKYAVQAQKLLRVKGKLVGVLFNREFPFEGPPFGGSTVEYESIFNSCFSSVLLEEAHNSFPPRQGSEVFIRAEK